MVNKLIYTWQWTRTKNGLLDCSSKCTFSPQYVFEIKEQKRMSSC